MSGFGLRLLYLTLAQRADDAAASERRRERHRRRSDRRRRLATDAFSMSDREFVKTNRLTKSVVANLITELTPHIPRERRSDGLYAAAKVSLSYINTYLLTSNKAARFQTLNYVLFLGTDVLNPGVNSGSYQTLVGQHCSYSVSQPSISMAVKQVLNHPHVFKKLRKLQPRLSPSPRAVSTKL